MFGRLYACRSLLQVDALVGLDTVDPLRQRTMLLPGITL
jgi:hypothetical protein